LPSTVRDEKKFQIQVLSRKFNEANK
jgi:hypothetical protein